MENLTELQAIIKCKCPRCRKGAIFSGKMYSFSIQKTNEFCSYCNLRYEREPGYFYVAMFVSYAMTVAEIVAIGVACFVFGLSLVYENLWYYVSIIIGSMVMLAPFNYRYSRVILLHWLTPGLHYMPEFTKKETKIQ